MKYAILFSIVFLGSCQSSKKYLKSHGIDCDCTEVVLEIKNKFYEISEKENLYLMKFKTKNKEEQHQEFDVFVKKYAWDFTGEVHKCVRQLNKEMVVKLFGKPTVFSQKSFYYYMPLNSKCIDSVYGTSRYGMCNWFSFVFFKNDMVEFFVMDYSLLW